MGPCQQQALLRTMAPMKLAILGVGSFVFGPSALHDAIVEHKFDGAHIALYDPNTAGMELMAQVARRMAAEAGIAS